VLKWHFQLSGVIDIGRSVPVYVIDLFETAPSVIASIRQQLKAVACHFSAGIWQEWQADAGSFPIAALGNAVSGWNGERWLDIRNATVLSLLAARLDLALQKGCSGVVPSNVDGYQQSSGFPLTADNQLTFNRWLAAQAHARGLSVGLKNDVSQVAALANDFDFALSESCYSLAQCGSWAPFVSAGKPVFEVEYVGDQAAGAILASQICPDSAILKFSTIVKQADLTAWSTDCP
jgi:hypothetical protein